VGTALYIKCKTQGDRRKNQKEKQYFMEKMSPEDGQRFEALADLYDDMVFDEEADIYTHGFTLGALLMQEVIEKKETMIGN